MVLVAAFTLRALKKSFFEGGPAAPAERPIHLEPITIPEKLGAGLLMFTTVAIGIYPKFLLDRMQPAVEAMRFLAR